MPKSVPAIVPDERGKVLAGALGATMASDVLTTFGPLSDRERAIVQGVVTGLAALPARKLSKVLAPFRAPARAAPKRGRPPERDQSADELVPAIAASWGVSVAEACRRLGAMHASRRGENRTRAEASAKTLQNRVSQSRARSRKSRDERA